MTAPRPRATRSRSTTGISDIDDPAAADGTHEGGIWSGGVAAAIIGNRIRDTGWDGIQTVGSSRGVTIVDNDIARTQTGIYLEHETNDSLFARNVIADVATGINVEWRYDGAGSSGNTFEGNTIAAADRRGIFVDVEGDATASRANLVARRQRPRRRAAGGLRQRGRGNRACDRARRAGRRPAERASRRRPRGQLAAQPHRRATRAPATCPGREPPDRHGGRQLAADARRAGRRQRRLLRLRPPARARASARRPRRRRVRDRERARDLEPGELRHRRGDEGLRRPAARGAAAASSRTWCWRAAPARSPEAASRAPRSSRCPGARPAGVGRGRAGGDRRRRRRRRDRPGRRRVPAGCSRFRSVRAAARGRPVAVRRCSSPRSGRAGG